MDVKRPGLSTLAYLIAAIIIAADQASKYYVIQVMHLFIGGPRVELLPFLHFTMVENRGVSFGLFQAGEGREWVRWIITGLSVVVSIALAFWVRSATRKLPAVAIGLIIGGAMGNVADRIRFGYVVDFIDFSPIFPWVFNIADSAITIGVALLLLDTFLVGDKSKNAQEAPL